MSFKRKLIETIGKVVFREVTVARVKVVADGFARVDFTGEALRGASYGAGDKVQILLDDGTRTYTPFAFDAARGAFSVVTYAHGGTSSGALWGASVREGDRHLIFGPRGSIPLADLGPRIVLVGDETSFGVARALRELAIDGARHVFEVGAPAIATEVLGHLEIAEATLVTRLSADAHHAELGARVADALGALPDARLVLTGKSTSIQAIRAWLKAHPVPHAGQKVKAYWAPGKRGLD